MFILSGQSNAAGNGNGDDLTAAQRKIDPEVLITFSDGVWEPLAPIKLKKPKAKFNINNTIFGTELSFAKAIKQAYPDDIIAICKVGVCGGTSIVAWEKDTDRPGWLDELDRLGNTSRAQMKLYETVINDTLKGIETLRQREDVGEVVLSGMWWCQTERDGSYLEFSEAYKKNLTNLINNIRKDLQAPNLPFLFFDQHIERKPGREVLKKNLRAVAAEVPFTALIDNNDLPKYEGIHFTTQGIWTLGERFAQAHLEMSE
ncbi:MAG: hypothetical protein HKP10_04710 [Kiritimatiellales bacterium]|nr:sialate O-acetylesterase [Pontiella sp.]NNJ70573.1 hypothetical protein [Kiritimatiellales bacterium]